METERATEQAPSEPSANEPAAAVDIEDYVWTGTELVRKDELERERPAEEPPEPPESPQER